MDKNIQNSWKINENPLEFQLGNSPGPHPELPHRERLQRRFFGQFGRVSLQQFRGRAIHLLCCPGIVSHGNYHIESRLVFRISKERCRRWKLLEHKWKRPRHVGQNTCKSGTLMSHQICDKPHLLVKGVFRQHVPVSQSTKIVFTHCWKKLCGNISQPNPNCWLAESKLWTAKHECLACILCPMDPRVTTN